MKYKIELSVVLYVANRIENGTITMNKNDLRTIGMQTRKKKRTEEKKAL